MKRTLLISISALLIAALLTGCALLPADLFTSVSQNDPTEPTDNTVTVDADYLAKLEEVVGLLDKVYIDGYDTDKLGDYLAEAAVAATGDRWSYYISAEDYAAYVESNENAYVGIGVTIKHENDDDPGFTIASVTHNSPAEEAGLKIGDMVVAVEGEAVDPEDMSAAQKKVRGEAGTDVTITILRDGERLDVTITRNVIETEVVVYELLDTNDGYIKINNFDAHSARDTIDAIDDLVGQGAKSLIFDLRFNPGGRKDELVQVLDYLLPEGPLFRSVDYLGNEEVDTSDASCLEMPMAVLINGDSYSAAEFFAAALQEYDWATVVGTQTCGKANYQQTFLLSDGSAVAVSTGHYQTPNGVTLADVGVTPDITVEVDDETYAALYYEQVEKADDAQLQTAISALNAGKSE